MGKVRVINLMSDGTYLLKWAVLRDKWIEQHRPDVVTMVNRDVIFKRAPSKRFETAATLAVAEPDKPPLEDVERQVVTFFNDPNPITYVSNPDDEAETAKREATVLNQVTRMQVVQSAAASVDRMETGAQVFMMLGIGAVAVAIITAVVIGARIWL